jgi:hypothetical protein
MEDINKLAKIISDRNILCEINLSDDIVFKSTKQKDWSYHPSATGPRDMCVVEIRSKTIDWKSKEHIIEVLTKENLLDKLKMELEELLLKSI